MSPVPVRLARELRLALASKRKARVALPVPTSTSPPITTSASQTDSPVVLITGGSQGIGAASVHRFLKGGWRVATVALPKENLHRWRVRHVVTLEGDITQEEVRKEIVDQAMARFGRLDALVNNAGVGLYATPLNLPPELLRRLLDINVIAPLALTQLVVPHIRKQRSGIIVNLGSVAGNVSMPWAFGYSASKFSFHAFNDSLRRELRKEGIRVVKICPGIVATRFRENVLCGSVPGKLAGLRPVVSAERVAEAIFNAVVSRSPDTVYVPLVGRLFSVLEHVCPVLMDRYLARLAEQEAIGTARFPEMSNSSVSERGGQL